MSTNAAVTIVVALLIALTALVGFGAYRIAYDNNVKDRQRVEACRTVEDESLRALCIVTSGERRR